MEKKSLLAATGGETVPSNGENCQSLPINGYQPVSTPARPQPHLAAEESTTRQSPLPGNALHPPPQRRYLIRGWGGGALNPI